MKPKHLVESLKLTYDLSYAREVAGKMVAAAYPQATEDEVPALMTMALNGFQLGCQTDGVNEWSLCDIEEFVKLYQNEFQKNGDAIGFYVMVDELLARIANRAAELASAIPEGLPFWFKAMYLKKAFVAAA